MPCGPALRDLRTAAPVVRSIAFLEPGPYSPTRPAVRVHMAPHPPRLMDTPAELHDVDCPATGGMEYSAPRLRTTLTKGALAHEQDCRHHRCDRHHPARRLGHRSQVAGAA